MLPNFYTYEVLQVHSFNALVAQINLRPLTLPLVYSAGQYVNVIHHDEVLSPLSIACEPRPDNSLEFHLYHAEWNLKAIELFNMSIAGKNWQLSGPFGNCTVDRFKLDVPIIFLARGSAFAPVKALMEAFSKLSLLPRIYFYWSAVQSEDFYLLDLLEQWQAMIKGFRFTLLPDITEKTAVQTILHAHPDLRYYQVYVGGSFSFVEKALQSFTHNGGLSREFFYSDAM